MKADAALTSWVASVGACREGPQFHHLEATWRRVVRGERAAWQAHGAHVVCHRGGLPAPRSQQMLPSSGACEEHCLGSRSQNSVVQGELPPPALLWPREVGPVDRLLQKVRMEPCRLASSQAAGPHPGQGRGCPEGEEKEKAGRLGQLITRQLLGAAWRTSRCRGAGLTSSWKPHSKPELVFFLSLCWVILIG